MQPTTSSSSVCVDFSGKREGKWERLHVARVFVPYSHPPGAGSIDRVPGNFSRGGALTSGQRCGRGCEFSRGAVGPAGTRQPAAAARRSQARGRARSAHDAGVHLRPRLGPANRHWAGLLAVFGLVDWRRRACSECVVPVPVSRSVPSHPPRAAR